MYSSTQSRTQIEDFLQAGQWLNAHIALGDLWRREGKATTAGFISSCYARLRPHLNLANYRVYFLRSMTLEPLIPILNGAASVEGMDLTTRVGQFGGYAQEILDQRSELYSFDPQVVFLVVQTRDILPEIWERYTDLSRDEVRAAVDKTLEEFAIWIGTFRYRSKACLVVHSLEKPVASDGILGSQETDSQFSAIDRFNAGLRQICCEHRGVYVLDYDGLVARHG